MTPAELNARFAIPGVLAFVAGQGELACADIATPAATARIYLHGAHITHWQPYRHEPVLYLSGAAVFAEGKAIRGGVPICLPWFGPATVGPPAGNPAAPAHGLVRTVAWNLLSASATPEGAVTLTLLLNSKDHPAPLWPFDYTVQLRVTFGHTLIMELQTTNAGTTAMPFEEALHTYLSVGDVRQITITGLEDAEYLDKTDKMARKKQTGAISFNAETDRVYLNTTSTCILQDPVKRRTITVSKTNSRSTIIWNPAPARAAQLTDIGAGQWPEFACIETANVSPGHVTVAPGEAHTMTATIAVQSP